MPFVSHESTVNIGIFTVLSCDTNGFEVKIGLGIGFEEVLTQLHVPHPKLKNIVQQNGVSTNLISSSNQT